MKEQPRHRPRIAPATVSVEAAAALTEMAENFYGGKKSRAIEAALVAWVTVVSDPSTHGLASKPHEALEAYCAARDGRGKSSKARDASKRGKGSKGSGGAFDALKQRGLSGEND